MDSVEEWGAFFNDTEARRVGYDKVGEARVSTVFLGIDHNFDDEGPPILFETMVFGLLGEEEQQWRYASYEDAVEGHRRAVKKTQKGGAEVTIETPARPAHKIDGPFRVEIRAMNEQSWNGNDVRFGNLNDAWTYGSDLWGRWIAVNDFRVMREGDDIPWAVYSCTGCAPYVAGELSPSHRGNRGCESGSLASSGDRAHCSCDSCF